MNRGEDATVVEAGEDHAITAEAVAQYLRRNPDFFADHADLLKAMTVPSRWSGDRVVDIQQYMVEILRGEIDGLRTCALEVIETSRSNLASQTRIHDAALALMAAADIDDLARRIGEELPILLGVDVAALAFEPTPVCPDLVAATIRRLPDGGAAALVNGGQDVALVGALDGDGAVFGEGASLVRSAALARLRPGGDLPEGVLAIGSRDADAFHPRQGTELVAFLARVAERCLQTLLAPRT